jgi:hypothetical protein
MFQVTAATLAEYLDFDRARRSDLVSLHALLRKTAPDLRRHFHKGTLAGEPGMRMKVAQDNRVADHRRRSAEELHQPVRGRHQGAGADRAELRRPTWRTQNGPQ